MLFRSLSTGSPNLRSQECQSAVSTLDPRCRATAKAGGQLMPARPSPSMVATGKSGQLQWGHSSAADPPSCLFYCRHHHHHHFDNRGVCSPISKGQLLQTRTDLVPPTSTTPRPPRVALDANSLPSSSSEGSTAAAETSPGAKQSHLPEFRASGSVSPLSAAAGTR